MSTLNRVELIGKVGAKNEIKELKSSKVLAFSIATSYKPKEADYITEWHRLEAWGKTAEFIDQYLNSGDLVYIEGRLKTTKSADGKYYTTIVVTEFKSLYSKKIKAFLQAQKAPQVEVEQEEVVF